MGLSSLFSKKISAVLVVDLSSCPKLLNVVLKGEANLGALKAIELASEKNDEAILNSLRDFLKENNIQHKNVLLSPALKSLLIKRIQLPAVPDAELPDAVRWKLKEDASVDLSKAIIDFRIIKRSAKEDGTKLLDVICAAAPNDEIKPQVQLLKQSGLNCVGVNLIPFGYAKFIEKYLHQEKNTNLAILHLGQEACYIAVYRENQLYFYRDLAISIKKLKESLTGTLISDKGQVQLTPEEVNDVLFNHGIPVDGATTYKDKMAASQILAMLRPTLERLAQEIKRSLAYYDAQFQGGAAEKILLSGEGSRIPNLVGFLSKELSLDVSAITFSGKFIASDKIDSRSLPEACGSFGLALDYDTGINLLPQEFRTEKIERVEKISLRLVTFIAILLLSVSFVFAKVRVNMYQKRLDNALIQLNVLSEVKQKREKLDNLNNFVIGIRNQDPSLGLMFKKISNISPKEILFNELNINCESKTGEIKGFIKTKDANPDTILTKFVEDMNNSGYVRNADIDIVEESSRKENIGINTFQVTFQLP